MLDLSTFKKPALQFSGGKDSLACLYLLRDQLDRITVYWLDSGDGCPETRAVIEAVRDWIPHFHVVQSDVSGWRAVHGNPSDVVPASAHWIGVAYGMAPAMISNRFDCCFHNIMAPMHRRMVEDGIDAVIRGTKACDTGRVPAEGPNEHYTVLLPLRDWSHADVFAYLESVGAPRNAIYDFFGSISAPECLGCTAWWDDNKAAYLMARHPEQHARYVAHLSDLRESLHGNLRYLARELGRV